MKAYYDPVTCHHVKIPVVFMFSQLLITNLNERLLLPLSHMQAQNLIQPVLRVSVAIFLVSSQALLSKPSRLTSLMPYKICKKKPVS